MNQFYEVLFFDSKIKIIATAISFIFRASFGHPVDVRICLMPRCLISIRDGRVERKGPIFLTLKLTKLGHLIYKQGQVILHKRRHLWL